MSEQKKRPERLVRHEEALALLNIYRRHAGTDATFTRQAMEQVLKAADIVAKDHMDVMIENGWCPNNCGPMDSRSSYGAPDWSCGKCGYRHVGCERCE